MLTSGGFYASFFREHKPLRFYANPTFYIVSMASYVSKYYESAARPVQKIGLDARTPATDKDRELIIFVVGETA
ncbi:MAG: phosphoethanolamine transferase domain-containing protein, partial [Gammaproteobacteria bacterium]